MKKTYDCKCCSETIEQDAIGLYRKLLDKSAKAYLCMNCLANHLDTTVEELREKAAEFKAEGCKLFS